MSDLQDPIHSKLWSKVQEITLDVYEGRATSAEQRAIAWRIAESQGNTPVIDIIKRDTSLPTDRFALAEKFLSEAKETEME